MKASVSMPPKFLAVFVLPRWNHRNDPQIQQVLVDPGRAASLVPAEGERPSDPLAVLVEQLLVGRREQFVQHGRFVRPAGRRAEARRQSMAVARDVDFHGKTPARAA